MIKKMNEKKKEKETMNELKKMRWMKNKLKFGSR
jgi:hypothetical protein